MLDKPIPELQTYQGLNPRPSDFDSFWEDSLAEMRAVDAKPELKPSKALAVPGAELFDLFFTGVRGSRIHAKFLRPSNRPGPCPAVLMFHGYSGSCGDWHDKLAYVGQGFCVAAMDCRGQGGLSEDTGGQKGTTFGGQFVRGLDGAPEDLLMRHIFLDTAQLASVIMAMPEVDPERVGALGGSQGGALTLACCALEPKLKRGAPVYPFLCDYRRVWEMDLAKDAYSELKNYFRNFDPRHEREDEIFTKLGYIDVQHLASRIRAEIVMACALMDSICPPSTQFAAFNKIPSKKRVVIYPDFGHENLPGFGDETFQFMLGL